MSKRNEMKWAIVHIFSSYNNTLVTATDLNYIRVISDKVKNKINKKLDLKD